MKDYMYEQLISKKITPIDIALRIASILVLVLLAYPGILFLGYLSMFLVVGWGLFIFFRLFLRTQTEYEYVLLNHDFQIDAIYNRTNRHELISFDLKNVTAFLPMSSHDLERYRVSKVLRYDSRTSSECYGLILSQNGRTICVQIEPDDTLLQSIKKWV